MDTRDVIVIGGGTSGFLAAQMAVQFGGRVMMVEKEKVGGICPDWGCIPMCFMDRCIETIRSIRRAGHYGIKTGEIQIDYARLMSQKENGV